jgi:hypothetical protein
MHWRWWTLAFLLCVAVSGCSNGVYSTTTASGTVVVVNRFTGAVQRVEGDKLVELHAFDPESASSAPTTAPIYRPVLAAMGIPKVPIQVTGLVKYRDGGIAMIVSVGPANLSMSDTEWQSWRDYMLRARPTASLNLEFEDKDGFVVVAHDVGLNEMRYIAGPSGDTIGYSVQLAIPVAWGDYTDITRWQVGWTSWPVYIPPVGSSPNGKGT